MSLCLYLSIFYLFVYSYSSILSNSHAFHLEAETKICSTGVYHHADMDQWGEAGVIGNDMAALDGVFWKVSSQTLS